eukprot:TRINITY_DN50391_c0_g1_i1.p2 TRINITY_DN50391_c0_g1~~TRINITY_DN50391_c0_g1_i1.p2  ORF type:complete len:156 (+),score=30.18 TRINITY_DN50391_c0_g1_i1:114-581(+)
MGCSQSLGEVQRTRPKLDKGAGWEDSTPRRMVRQMRAALEDLSPLPKKLRHRLSPKRRKAAALLEDPTSPGGRQVFPQEPFVMEVECWDASVVSVHGMRRLDKVADLKQNIVKVMGATQDVAKFDLYCFCQPMEDDHLLQEYSIPWDGVRVSMRG